RPPIPPSPCHALPPCSCVFRSVIQLPESTASGRAVPPATPVGCAGGGGRQRISESSVRSADLDLAPVSRCTGFPSENSSSAGMAVIWYSAASSWLASTSTLATVSLSDSEAASSSRTGAIMVQGRHQAAEKSTSTGFEPLASMTAERSEERRAGERG